MALCYGFRVKVRVGLCRYVMGLGLRLGYGYDVMLWV